MENIDNNFMKLDRKNDGIYLILDKSLLKDVKLTLGNVISFIENNGIQDWDFASVSSAFNSRDRSINVKISSNVSLKAVDERITIDISRNKMSASITFFPPQNGGNLISFDEVKTEIANKGIIFGVDFDAVKRLMADKSYGKPYAFASGIEPVHGKNAELIFYFNTEQKTLKPKVLEGGKVDYRDLSLIELATQGQKLITLVPATDGTPGKNVFGADVSNMKGKQLRMPSGKNVRLSSDGLDMFSEIDGQIIYSNNKISVLPVYEVRGNVDNSTGNIRFIGTVIVYGNVLTGFSIISSGNVEIFGVVEGANIHSDEDIIIHSGVQGLGKCKLTAAGNIKAKYIENCTLNAGKDISADAIMHSDVRCGNVLSVQGRKGLLVGGTIMVGSEVSAKVIGSQMATVTEIEVGFELGVYDKYNSLKKTLSALKSELTGTDRIIENLIKLKAANQLNDSKKSILIKSIRTKSFLLEKIVSTQKEIEATVQLLQRNRGKIKAETVIHPGVKVTIGNAIMYIREEIKYCVLYNERAEIKIGSYA